MKIINRSIRVLAAALMLSASGCATVDGALQKGDVAAATGLAEKQKSPERETNLVKIADARFEKKEYLAAAELYQKAGPQGKAGMKKAGTVLARLGDFENGERIMLASGMERRDFWRTTGEYYLGIRQYDVAYGCFVKAGDAYNLKQVADEFRRRNDYAKAEEALRKAGVPEKEIFDSFGRYAMPGKPREAAEFYEKSGNIAELAKAAAQLETLVAKQKDDRAYNADRDPNLAAYVECVYRFVRLGAQDRAAPIVVKLIEWNMAKRADGLFSSLKDPAPLIALAARSSMKAGQYRYARSLFEKIDGRAEFVPLLESAEKEQWTVFAASDKERENARAKIVEIGKLYVEAGLTSQARGTADSFARAARYTDALPLYRAVKADEKDFGAFLFDLAAKSKDKYYIGSFARLSGVKKNLTAAADILMEKESYLEAMDLYEEGGSKNGAAKAFSVIAADVKDGYDDPDYEALIGDLPPQEKRAVTLLLYMTTGGASISVEYDTEVLVAAWIKQDGVEKVKNIEARYNEFSRAYSNVRLGLPPKTTDRDAVAKAIIEKSKDGGNALLVAGFTSRTLDRVSASMAKAISKAK